MSQVGVLTATVLALLLSAGSPALAQTFNSGSTGADGAFNPNGLVTIQVPPSGVFNFTTINISNNTTLRFARNATNTPVTLLATGDVTITGRIEMAGAPGGFGLTGTAVGGNGGAGGPGGSDGGSGATGVVSTTGGTGLGPGGGAGGVGPGSAGGGGGHAVAGANGTGGTPGAGGAAYGVPALLPLVGGSGGGGGGASFGLSGGGGGGGGGALIIASSGTITLNFGSRIVAGGGAGASGVNLAGLGPAGGGSGGSVRLIANTVTSFQGPSAVIDVAGGAGGVIGALRGGNGSAGRVRIEAFSNNAIIEFGSVPNSAISSAAPTSVTATNAPTLRITSVGGIAAPASPTGSRGVPDVTLPAGTTNPVTVAIAGANIPVGTVVTVTASGQYGAASSATGTLAGSQAASTTSASLTVPTNQPSVISASASFQVTALNGGTPLFVHGEEIDRVEVSATTDGTARVVYLTKWGREVAVAR